MKTPAIFLVVPVIAACSYMPDTSGLGKGISNALDVTPMLNPYRIDVRQGNMVTQDMVAQLKLGQTKDQVRFILGTPLLNDIFHADRWDYVYRFQSGGALQQRRVVVFFENGKLASIGGDVVGDASVAANAAPKPVARVIEIKAPEGPAKPDPAPAEAAAAPQ